MIVPVLCEHCGYFAHVELSQLVSDQKPARLPAYGPGFKCFRCGQYTLYTNPIVCSNCGRPGQVPFAPRTDRPVFCSECFETRRTATARSMSPN